MPIYARVEVHSKNSLGKVLVLSENEDDMKDYADMVRSGNTTLHTVTNITKIKSDYLKLNKDQLTDECRNVHKQAHDLNILCVLRGIAPYSSNSSDYVSNDPFPDMKDYYIKPVVSVGDFKTTLYYGERKYMNNISLPELAVKYIYEDDLSEYRDRKRKIAEIDEEISQLEEKKRHI